MTLIMISMMPFNNSEEKESKEKRDTSRGGRMKNIYIYGIYFHIEKRTYMIYAFLGSLYLTLSHDVVLNYYVCDHCMLISRSIGFLSLLFLASYSYRTFRFKQ